MSAPVTQQPAQGPGITTEHKRVLAGSMVGTTIEWFDFFIYAQAAGLIFATQYFDPVSNESASLAQIIAWASLGISFLFRPLGAILAGHLGDRLGRKPVLVVTLVGMGLATMLMGVLPTYASIGMAAPILLVVLRILQGLSAGGEWGGAAMLAVEHAPHGKRGLFGAFPQVGVPLGMFLATIFMLVLSAVLTPEQFLAWGWRIPFLSSVVLILLGYLIRRAVEESPAFAEMEELKEKSTAPLGPVQGPPRNRHQVRSYLRRQQRDWLLRHRLLHSLWHEGCGLYPPPGPWGSPDRVDWLVYRHAVLRPPV